MVPIFAPVMPQSEVPVVKIHFRTCGKMENLAIEIKFAQNLAGNETKTRLKALKKLKKYLRAKSASKKGNTKSSLCSFAVNKRAASM